MMLTATPNVRLSHIVLRGYTRSCKARTMKEAVMYRGERHKVIGGVSIFRPVLLSSGRALFATALVLGVLAAAGCSSSSSGSGTVSSGASGKGATTVSVGVVSTNADQLGIMDLTKDAGYFADEGLNVKIAYLSSGVLRTAISGGTVQIAAFGAPSGEELELNKVPVTVIADPIPTSLFTIVVAPGISSVAGLAGKPVVVSSSASADELYLDSLLRADQLSLSNIKLVVDQESAQVSLFGSGSVDAVVAAPPQNKDAAKARPGSTILTPSTGGVALPQSELVGYAPFLEKNPTVAVKFLTAFLRGEALFKSNATRTKAELVSTDSSLSGTALDETYTSVADAFSLSPVPSAQTEQGILDVLKTLGAPYSTTTQNVKAADLINTSYITQAMAASK
jgi:ABC-type nitrate/sulfonate/bicarbonate transport system substrate-binding protein